MKTLQSHVEIWNHEAQCLASAKRLGERLCNILSPESIPVCMQNPAHKVLNPPACSVIIELHGDLGAGKTTFVRQLLYALGITGFIKSPSYSLMLDYVAPNKQSISHCDFYRFKDPQEWEDAGFRDVFAQPGIKLIEWPNQVRPWLPTPDLQLQLQVTSETSRQVIWSALTTLGLSLLPR